MDSTEGKQAVKRFEDAMKKLGQAFGRLRMVDHEAMYAEVANAIADAYNDTYEGESIPVWIRRTGERLGKAGK